MSFNEAKLEMNDKKIIIDIKKEKLHLERKIKQITRDLSACRSKNERLQKKINKLKAKTNPKMIKQATNKLLPLFGLISQK
jgi:predicted  nucleic acid-binding Zn-ribbon protein